MLDQFFDEPGFFSSYEPEWKLSRAILYCISQMENAQSYRERFAYFEQRAQEEYQWIEEQIQKTYQTAPRNLPLATLLTNFATRGKRAVTRPMLYQRLAHAEFAEQYQIILTLSTAAQRDINYALSHIDKNWDEAYTSIVQQIWEQSHHPKAAIVITHHFSPKFIEENMQELIAQYDYLHVRLRLPADYPIDRNALNSREYLYLCARQHIEISDADAEQMLYQTVADNAFHRISVEIDKPLLVQQPEIASAIYSLGCLGKLEVLLAFNKFNIQASDFIRGNKPFSLKKSLMDLGIDINFKRMDYIMCHELEYYETYYITEKTADSPEIIEATKATFPQTIHKEYIAHRFAESDIDNQPVSKYHIGGEPLPFTPFDPLHPF